MGEAADDVAETGGVDRADLLDQDASGLAASVSSASKAAASAASS